MSPSPRAPADTRAPSAIDKPKALDTLDRSQPIFFETSNNSGALLAELTNIWDIDPTTCELRMRFTSHPEFGFRFREARMVWSFESVAEDRAAPSTRYSIPESPASSEASPTSSTDPTPRIKKLEIRVGASSYALEKDGELQSVATESPKNTTIDSLIPQPTIQGRVEGGHKVEWTVEEDKHTRSGLPLTYDVVVGLTHVGGFKTTIKVTGEIRTTARGIARVARQLVNPRASRDLSTKAERLVHVTEAEPWSDMVEDASGLGIEDASQLELSVTDVPESADIEE